MGQWVIFTNYKTVVAKTRKEAVKKAFGNKKANVLVAPIAEVSRVKQ